MAEYTQDSTIFDRLKNATKAFVHDGIKSAIGGAMLGAIVMVAAGYIAPVVAVVGLTEIAASIVTGGAYGALIGGALGATFSAFSELAKPPVDLPHNTQDKLRVISPQEARSLQPAIDISAEPARPVDKLFTDRITQQRAREAAQARTIH